MYMFVYNCVEIIPCPLLFFPKTYPAMSCTFVRADMFHPGICPHKGYRTDNSCNAEKNYSNHNIFYAHVETGDFYHILIK